MSRSRSALGASCLVVAVVAPGAAQEPRYGLPEVTVSVSQDWCPASDQELARAAIRDAVGRVSDASSFDRIGAQVRSVHRRVPMDAVGREPVPPTVVAVFQGSTAFARSIWLDAIGGGAFAKPLDVSSLDGRFESWEYAPLYAELSYYFFSGAFLEAHEFAYLDSGADQVGFCAKERRETFIDGRIVLGTEGQVESVDWIYITPDPDEGAGGRAEFDSASSEPLPAVGVFWRRLPLGDFQEWTDEYLSWSR